MNRQGDLLIIKIDEIPQGLEVDKDGIILRGEVTGHSHKIFNGLVYRGLDGIYLRADIDAEITHEEHATLELNPGNYKVVRQREYVSKEEEQYVQD